MPKFDFNKVALKIFSEVTLCHGCCPVNLLYFSEHIFLRTPLEECAFIPCNVPERKDSNTGVF